jgi:hypothetical protein
MHKGERGSQKMPTKKKRTFHTITNHQNNVEGTLHMSDTHLSIFAQLQQLTQEFSSPNIHPNWQKGKKIRGVGWENLHKKLSPESNALCLAYNITLRVLYRPPSSTTLSSHCVHRSLWRCTLCQEHDSSSKRKRKGGAMVDKRGREWNTKERRRGLKAFREGERKNGR